MSREIESAVSTSNVAGGRRRRRDVAMVTAEARRLLGDARNYLPMWTYAVGVVDRK